MPSLSVGLLSAEASTSAAATALSASMAVGELDGSLGRVVSSIVSLLLGEGRMVLTLELVSCDRGEDWASVSGGCVGLGWVSWLLLGGPADSGMLMI